MLAARDLPVRRVRARPRRGRTARAQGAVHALEPQVFALLALLVENRDRLYRATRSSRRSGTAGSSRTRPSRAASSRRARRWGTTARASDSSAPSMARASASSPTVRAVQAARQSPRRWHGCGEATPRGRPALSKLAKPSIAVLPFRLVGDAGPYAGDRRGAARRADHRPRAPALAVRDGARLLVPPARLGRGHGRDRPAARRALCPRGLGRGPRHATSRVSVELVDTRDAGIVWAERFGGALDDVHHVRDEIRQSVLAALEIQIPQHEAALARLNVSEDLDAWSAYHLGLQHMYRFNRQDNAAATALFQRAIAQRSRLRARARGPLVRPFPDRVPAPHRRPGGRGRRRRGASRRGRRARCDGSVRELRDGPHALAGGRPRRRTALAGARNGPQPQLRAGHLRSRLDRDARRTGARRTGARRPRDAPVAARPALLRDARHPRLHRT